MSVEERFTEEERMLLGATPSLIGSTMAFAGSSGLGTVKELMASAQSYMGGAKQFPNSELIRSLVPDMNDREGSMEKAKAIRDFAVNRLKDKGIKTQDAMKMQLLADCRDIANLLRSKASEQEADEYKQWAMSVAENVAKAAKEGGFLGFGGEQVSAEEKELFRQLGAALGVPGNLA